MNGSWIKKMLGVCFVSAIFFSPQYLSAAEAVSDDTIISDIKSELAADKTTSDLKVKVTSANGEVSLSGKVNTDQEVSRIVEIAESTPGVSNTDTSQLTVKKSSKPLADTIITAKVKGIFIREKLFGDKDVSTMTVAVETTNGIVYLTGTVNSQQEADNAVKLAGSVAGVKSVDSKIEVAPSGSNT